MKNGRKGINMSCKTDYMVTYSLAKEAAEMRAPNVISLFIWKVL